MTPRPAASAHRDAARRQLVEPFRQPARDLATVVNHHSVLVMVFRVVSVSSIQCQWWSQVVAGSAVNDHVIYLRARGSVWIAKMRSDASNADRGLRPTVAAARVRPHPWLHPGDPQDGVRPHHPGGRGEGHRPRRYHDRVHCPGRKPQNRAVKRPARPYKAPYKTDFHRKNLRSAKGA